MRPGRKDRLQCAALPNQYCYDRTRGRVALVIDSRYCLPWPSTRGREKSEVQFLGEQGMSVGRRLVSSVSCWCWASSCMLACPRSHKLLVCAGNQLQCACVCRHLTTVHPSFIHRTCESAWPQSHCPDSPQPGYMTPCLCPPRSTRAPHRAPVAVSAWNLSPTLRWGGGTAQAGVWASRLCRLLPVVTCDLAILVV